MEGFGNGMWKLAQRLILVEHLTVKSFHFTLKISTTLAQRTKVDLRAPMIPGWLNYLSFIETAADLELAR